jgi:hypothetical protein
MGARMCVWHLLAPINKNALTVSSLDEQSEIEKNIINGEAKAEEKWC